MGIIMGALAGAGDYIARSEMQNQQRMDTMDLENHRSDLEMRKAKMVDDLRNQSAINTENRAIAQNDKLRTDQVARIDQAVGKIADTAVEGKRGLINSGIADPAAWTGEQQAAVDQSLAADKKAADADPKTRIQAAISTGDIDPKTAATLGQKDDSAFYKVMYENLREDGRDKRQLVAEDGRNSRQAEALLQKNEGGGNIAHEERLRYTSLFQEAGRRVAEAQKTLSTLTTGSNSLLFNMAVKRDPNGLEAKQLDELRSTIKTHNEERTLFQGFLAGSQGAEKPAPAPTANLDKTTAKPAAAIAPALAGNMNTGKQGQIDILQQEWDKSTALLSKAGSDEEEKTRQQTNLKDLTKEFKNLGVMPGSLTKSTVKTDAAPPTVAAGLSTPKTQAEFNAIPSGTDYVNPSDGKTYRKK